MRSAPRGVSQGLGDGVEMMGGAIGFVGEAERGSTFWFELPVTSEADAASSVESEASETPILPPVDAV